MLSGRVEPTPVGVAFATGLIGRIAAQLCCRDSLNQSRFAAGITARLAHITAMLLAVGVAHARACFVACEYAAAALRACFSTTGASFTDIRLTIRILVARTTWWAVRKAHVFIAVGVRVAIIIRLATHPALGSILLGVRRAKDVGITPARVRKKLCATRVISDYDRIAHTFDTESVGSLALAGCYVLATGRRGKVGQTVIASDATTLAQGRVGRTLTACIGIAAIGSAGVSIVAFEGVGTGLAGPVLAGVAHRAWVSIVTCVVVVGRLASCLWVASVVCAGVFVVTIQGIGSEALSLRAKIAG